MDIGKKPTHDACNYWTALEDQKLVELQKTNKSYLETPTALGGAHSYRECRAHWFNKFWVGFNTSNVDGSFDLDKYEQKIGKRGGVFERGGDSERGGAAQMYDVDFDADGDSDYEEE